MQLYQYGMLNPKPRVLIVDNDPRTRIVYQNLLLRWDFEPVLAFGEHNSLIRDAKEKARQLRCNLAIIDMDLINDFDEDDISGLTLAKEIKPAHCIILFGQSNQKVLNEILGRSEHINFVKKTDSTEGLKQVLEAEATQISALKRELQINPPDIFEKIFQAGLGDLAGLYPDQIVDVLAQLFPHAKNLKVEKLDTKSQSSSISTVPRPKSVVLKVYEEDYEPVIVKMARANKIAIEVERYEKYVSNRLTRNFYARMERHVVLWDIGGISYSYVGDFDVTTFSRYYEEQSVEDIEECLTSFFNISWGRHYARAQEVENVSLFEMYNKVWGDWYERKVSKFVMPIVRRPMRIHAQTEPANPIEWLKKNVTENPEKDASRFASTKIAVTHGDLHADNLMIDSRKSAWVIDFERSGEGHALQDFVELEADLLNRLPYNDGDGLQEFYNLWLTVIQQTEIGAIHTKNTPDDPEIDKIIRVVSIIRTLAHQCTDIADFRQYLWGLLFNAIFRATIISKDDPHKKSQVRSLMLASIICHRLEHWGEPWPPEEWLNTL